MKEIEFDFFGDGMRIFLDYIARETKKKPAYIPHPLIRAFECAIRAMGKEPKNGERFMGVSQDGTETEIYNPFIVIIEKCKTGIEIVRIVNIKVNKDIPVDVMVTIFRLQIVLDRFGGDTVSPRQMTDALNAVISGNKFYYLGEKWKDARDEFNTQLKAGKHPIPDDPEVVKDLSTLTDSTPWEDYSSKLRTLIGSAIALRENLPNGTIIIVSPKDTKIQRCVVFDSATEFLLGEAADILKSTK